MSEHLDATDREMIAGLIESYGTREALAEEVMSRIDECLELRKQLAEAKRKRAPKELTDRIRELEKQLADVNGKLINAQAWMDAAFLAHPNLDMDVAHVMNSPLQGRES